MFTHDGARSVPLEGEGSATGDGTGGSYKNPWRFSAKKRMEVVLRPALVEYLLHHNMHWVAKSVALGIHHDA